MPRGPSFRQALKQAVAERRLLVIPGAYDALSALLIERAGFDTMFVGGFPVAGARYGVPDIGLKGFSDIAAAVRDIIAACDVPVLVAIDDGYGDVKNAVHTVQAYERMGMEFEEFKTVVHDDRWDRIDNLYGAP
jgi:2-methylisocitrate lyase-like PEP mutase family enzyme